MSKREKTEGHQAVKVVSAKRDYGTSAVTTQMTHRADPSLLDPYDWGPDGIPRGKPLRYVSGQGFVLED